MTPRPLPGRIYRYLDGFQTGPPRLVWWLIHLRWPYVHYCPDWDFMVIGHPDELHGCGCPAFRDYERPTLPGDDFSDVL